MADVLLTFHCATQDTEIVTTTIRASSRAPVHISEDTVRGWDYDDASTAEQVSGLLRRHALALIIDEAAATRLVEAVVLARRELPVRWHAVTVVAHGRAA
jgi:hypothetical protein